jgi:single-strand DNA-binding protein
MSGINKAIIIGNCGKDPEIRTFQTGGQVASFSVATSESWKDKATGEKREKTEWHRISVFNEHLISIVERFVKKGTRLYVEGQIETRKWQDKSGEEKYTTEIVLRPFRGEIQILEFNKDKDGGDDKPAAKYSEAAKMNYTAPTAPDLDDDIPF